MVAVAIQDNNTKIKRNATSSGSLNEGEAVVSSYNQGNCYVINFRREFPGISKIPTGYWEFIEFYFYLFVADYNILVITLNALHDCTATATLTH